MAAESITWSCGTSTMPKHENAALEKAVYGKSVPPPLGASLP